MQGPLICQQEGVFAPNHTSFGRNCGPSNTRYCANAYPQSLFCGCKLLKVNSFSITGGQLLLE